MPPGDRAYGVGSTAVVATVRQSLARKIKGGASKIEGGGCQFVLVHHLGRHGEQDGIMALRLAVLKPVRFVRSLADPVGALGSIDVRLKAQLSNPQRIERSHRMPDGIVIPARAGRTAIGTDGIGGCSRIRIVKLSREHVQESLNRGPELRSASFLPELEHHVHAVRG